MPRILIIDDDKDICLVLSKFLTKNNYDADVAYKGEEGLKLLRASRYNLVLCDYRLPDLTGVEMLRKIKLLQSDVAVVISTGYSDVRTAVETFRYGANDYVTKPLYPDELLVTIRETIAKNEKKAVNGESAEAAQDPPTHSHAPIWWLLRTRSMTAQVHGRDCAGVLGSSAQL